MNFSWNIEVLITLFFIISSLVGSFFIIKLDFKRYGLLFLLSGTVGILLCLIFLKIGFYSFPFRLFPNISSMPFETIFITIPFLVLVSVKYSPKAWDYKIPFYWAVVHIVMAFETLALLNTKLIEYNFQWDFWDSYTWWWIYFLIFEWIGSLIITDNLRNPISAESFRYGKWAFAIFHFIIITTIFLGGYYLGFIRS